MTWTFENLDHFLTNPKGFIPGTAMAFAGLKKPDERANVIAYLRTLSDNPVPLPGGDRRRGARRKAPAPAAGAEKPARSSGQPRDEAGRGACRHPPRVRDAGQARRRRRPRRIGELRPRRSGGAGARRSRACGLRRALAGALHAGRPRWRRSALASRFA